MTDPEIVNPVCGSLSNSDQTDDNRIIGDGGKDHNGARKSGIAIVFIQMIMIWRLNEIVCEAYSFVCNIMPWNTSKESTS